MRVVTASEESSPEDSSSDDDDAEPDNESSKAIQDGYVQFGIQRSNQLQRHTFYELTKCLLRYGLPTRMSRFYIISMPI